MGATLATGQVPTIVAMTPAEAGHELPAGVRVALWGTLVLTGRLPVAELPARALPDLDDCRGLVEQVDVWAALGERVLLVALPRPGDLTGMPHGPADLHGAASRAQECVYVPGLGGALVPELSTYGPPGDEGWTVTWTAYPADPVPTHRVEALDLGQTELSLRTELAALTEQLAAAGAPPFGAAAQRGMGRARAAQEGGRWGLPEGLPPRAVRVLDLAGTVLQLADVGLDTVTESVDAASVARRGVLLRSLQSLAARALADTTNVAALHLARG